MAQHPPPPPLVGQGLLIIENSRSHSDTLHSVGLLWTSDQPVAETSTWQHTTDKSMPPVVCEPEIPASERPQTDCAATGIGTTYIGSCKLLPYVTRGYPAVVCRPKHVAGACNKWHTTYKLQVIEQNGQTLTMKQDFTFKGPCIVKYVPIIVQDATMYSLILSVNRSTCFGWYLLPPSGVTATCRERDWMGTAVSIQWRSRQVAVTVTVMPDTVDTVTWAADDGWRYRPKHVERFTDINKLYTVASCWTIIGIAETKVHTTVL